MNEKMYSTIAAIRSEEDLKEALLSDCNVIFDLNPDILTISETVKKVHKTDKKLFIHIDLADGIGKDRSGVLFAKKMGIDGIISTRVNMIKLAREAGIFTVQRFFVVDSHSVDTALDAIKSAKPDMIEVMPGVAVKAISELKDGCSVPIIAGGLIETEAERENAIKNGATAVSTGKYELWKEVK